MVTRRRAVLAGSVAALGGAGWYLFGRDRDGALDPETARTLLETTDRLDELGAALHSPDPVTEAVLSEMASATDELRATLADLSDRDIPVAVVTDHDRTGFLIDETEFVPVGVSAAMVVVAGWQATRTSLTRPQSFRVTNLIGLTVDSFRALSQYVPRALVGAVVGFHVGGRDTADRFAEQSEATAALRDGVVTFFDHYPELRQRVPTEVASLLFEDVDFGPAVAIDPSGTWPMRQVDARHTGHAPTPSIPGDGVEEGWRFRPFHGVVESAPVATAETLVTCGWERLPDDTSRTNVYGVDPTSGAPMWRTDLPFVMDDFAAPAIRDGAVFVPARSGYSEPGVLGAFSLEDGSTLWRTEGVANGSSSPVVVDSTVYVGDYDAVYALDADTGETRWVTEIDAPIRTSSPAVGDDRLYIGGANEPRLFCLDRATGERLWSYRVQAGAWAEPTVGAEHVYIGDHAGTLHAVRPDGSRAWTYETGHEIDSSAAVEDGSVFCLNDDQRLVSVAAADGTERWSIDLTPSGTSATRSAPVAADGAVVVPAGPDVRALDAADGTERWRYEFDHLPPSSVVGLDGVWFVSGGNYGVAALAESTDG